MSKTREIKFRAWDEKEKIISRVISLDTGCWDKRGRVYSVILQKAGEYEGPGPIVGTALYRSIQYRLCIIPEHLMQYTGLKDKNGKEIYEGDIVEAEEMKSDYADDREIRIEKYRNVVEYGPPAFMWADKESEVIGNIYESPGLLGERSI